MPRLQPLAGKSATRRAGAGDAAQAAPGSTETQDIDHANVEAIRQAISEGKLEIRAERIADGLIGSVRELLQHDLS
nr:flagellar biosynthesis anti-sigma factor FlgM [Pseudomonas sp. NW5]